MDNKTNSLTDNVNVSFHQSSLAADSSYARIQRNTACMGNVVSKILETNSILDRETLLYAGGLFRNAYISLLKNGKAVDILELGTMYIKAKSGIDTATPSITDVPELTVAFTPSSLATQAVKDLTAGADITCEIKPVIEGFFNLTANSSSYNISSGDTVRLTGDRLKISGSDTAAGIYLIPCDSEGIYKEDGSDWIRIDSGRIIDNKPSVLAFNLPDTLASGSYRIGVRTCFGSGNGATLKTPRTGISEGIFTAA